MTSKQSAEKDVIWRVLMDHPDPIRQRNPRGGEPVMVWRCTGDGCDWLHLPAHDGGAQHFAHQAEKIAAALRPIPPEQGAP